jgi:hypothetical protein
LLKRTTVKASSVVPAPVQTQIRSYRAKLWIRAFALFFLAFSLAGLVNFWGDIFAEERSSSPTEILVPGLMVLTGIYLVAHFFTARVTLFPDAIEVQTIWSTKRMDFNRIRGRREYETTDSDGVKTRNIKLEPLGYQQPALEFQDLYNFDAEFYEWLRSLPKLGQ